VEWITKNKEKLISLLIFICAVVLAFILTDAILGIMVANGFIGTEPRAQWGYGNLIFILVIFPISGGLFWIAGKFTNIVFFKIERV
jgi:hypothetical protein